MTEGDGEKFAPGCHIQRTSGPVLGVGTRTMRNGHVVLFIDEEDGMNRRL